MTTLTGHLTTYATYHRDRRNIATHFFGIPAIFFAITLFLARPGFDVAGITLTPGMVVGLLASIFYLRLELRFGLAMTALTALSVWGSTLLAAQSTTVWLSSAIGLFVGGWALQFLGHFWEGKKPAFVDDLVGLLVGPLFIVAETAFALGLRHDVLKAIEAQAGPTCIKAPRSQVAAGR